MENMGTTLARRTVPLLKHVLLQWDRQLEDRSRRDVSIPLVEKHPPLGNVLAIHVRSIYIKTGS
jgi:hypothetical protein